jgi:arylsulfatase A-like enzyme
MSSTLYPLFVTLWLSLLVRTSSQSQKPNVLFLLTDQLRFDAIGRVQDELSAYTGSLKIRTPNLDRLSREGAYFRTVYTQCPVCGPARTSLRTGCTIERTGVQTNPLSDAENRQNPKLFQDKIDQLESLDQILVEDRGYLSEYYGKWHLPERLYHHRDGGPLAVQYNDYDYSDDASTFSNKTWTKLFRGYLKYFRKRGDFEKTFAPGQQEDSYSRYPYTPITLDARFGLPTNSDLKDSDNFNDFQHNENSQIGNYTLGKQFTASFLNHDVALRALTRLAAQDTPFFLTVSYHHPHPPFMAPFEYLSYYWDRRDELFTSPTVGIPLDDTTSYYSSKHQQKLQDAGYCVAENNKEWTAVYYAMVEEIDTLVGIMLDRLDELGIADNTLVVFTSDHGEMLGAHCQRGKGTFFEEAVRVPLFVKLPGVIPTDTIVEEPVNLIDVFSTILDYTGAVTSDNGDGFSLRHFIDGTSYNYFFDETAAVSEWDFREPIGNDKLSRDLVSRPNFMLRHGDFKLCIHKKADSRKPDLLFNLAVDPFEMNNLIKRDGPEPDDSTIAKAEHLRYLLLDWMERVQLSPNNQFYSDPIYNANEGHGDIAEILARQSWRSSDVWVGDPFLVFRKASLAGSKYVRNEWLYIGRRSPDSLIMSMIIVGDDASLFRLGSSAGEVPSQGVFRLKVTFEHETMPQALKAVDAFIRIDHSAGDPIDIPLLVQSNCK